MTDVQTSYQYGAGRRAPQFEAARETAFSTRRYYVRGFGRNGPSTLARRARWVASELVLTAAGSRDTL